MTDTPEILDLIGDVLSTCAIGDELLTVKWVSFHDWYDQNKFILGFGANDSGGHSGAFQYLEQIAGSSNILPEDDSITFQLRRLGGSRQCTQSKFHMLLYLMTSAGIFPVVSTKS
ncbi:hypothetical protein BASA62_001175 [Batrachochytrium salamandrivorans]|nr:hypothetical protein BASA62_001175 [Batrachochytrium salamandrivorans]